MSKNLSKNFTNYILLGENEAKEIDKMQNAKEVKRKLAYAMADSFGYEVIEEKTVNEKSS